MPIFSINYILNFNIGSVIDFKDRYLSLDTLYISYITSFFANYNLNLEVKTVDVSLTDMTATSASAVVNASNTLKLSYY